MQLKKREWYIPERTGYAFNISARSGIGGLIGYGGKLGLEGIGYVLDLFHNRIIPVAAKSDQHLGKVIVEQGGKIGEVAIQVDKAQGDLWSKVFGRSAEDQRKWRQEHGLEHPKYIEEPKTSVTIEVTPPAQIQPTNYRDQFSTYGDSLTSLGFLAGLAWGVISGHGKYRAAKKQKTLLAIQREVLRETKDLNARVTEIERRLSENPLENKAGETS